MKTIITITAFFVCSMLSAQTQYETGMQKALSLWGEGKPAEATALFERIASAEKTNWLPNYYIGMINAIEAFNPKNREKATALIEKAQNAVDNATLISPNNAEIMVLQAMVYTAVLVQDPMTNGMKYSGLAMEQYYKALAIAPNNPRVVFSKAEFEIGGAKWSGADTKPMCEQISKSIELFATFKPETVFHPNWGLDRAKEALKNCK
jgi:tetratricopeptide (TPR) repeat protein